ncbi:diguanylate cyclase [Bermanella marisrubri]|uniref:diguanylate cyclase n=1 Tax=Bermanella marisrubri TaxID=207949 RepID=Q1MYJ5_9GAMM|nr:diguanylate cyclase [Bermanella marisrubri]EAT11036.1 Response regulator containing a CheY-like receiver domain and a GGDEF domain [Oceanobacter sp. RED65] [Bermanella marisrubri]QIZ82977.1 diguanylate cyclase [Bermanella marisrubri]
MPRKLAHLAVLLPIMLCCSALAHAETAAALRLDPNANILAPHIWFIEDAGNDLHIADILEDNQRSTSQLQWQKNTWPQINFGFSEKAYWLKTSIINPHPANEEWVLEIAYPLLDRVEIYAVNEAQQVVGFYHAGDKAIGKEKQIAHPNIAFPVQFPHQEQYTLYIHVKSEGSTQVPLTIWSWSDFISNSIIHFLFQGFFYGMVLIMALYNFVVWLIVRQRVYLSYVAYILFLTLFQISLHGLGMLYVWKEYTWLNEYITTISLILLLASISFFIRDFFDIKKYSPNLSRLVLCSFYWYLLLSIVFIFIPYSISIRIGAFFAWTQILLIIYITLYMLNRGHPSSRYFAVAWAVFLIGALLLALNKFAFLPITLASEYGLQIGAGLEIMFLSLALADRMANTQREKISAQARSLDLAHQVTQEREKLYRAEMENLKIAREHNEVLEKTVDDRTKELSEALEELSNAHEKLKNISVTDALTKIHNRYFFDQHWRSEFKRAHRHKMSIALIILDIDHFKKVNDNFGHPAGDLCLQKVAQSIRIQANRESDLVCRLGGEEFAVILPGTDEMGAYEVAEKIRHTIEKRHISWEGKTIKITVSIGISAMTPRKSDEKMRNIMFNQADQALYQAKGNGRNRTVIFESNVT